MRIAGLKTYDIADCTDGACVSVWFQGCPHHCIGCHNPQTWSFSGGKQISFEKLYSSIIKFLIDLKVKTGNINLSLLGGEPLCPENIEYVYTILKRLEKIKYQDGVDLSDLKVYCWTGYEYESELKRMANKNKHLNWVLKRVDVLVDGRFDISKRDTTLLLRGSKNQSVWYKKKFFFNKLSKLVKQPFADMEEIK